MNLQDFIKVGTAYITQLNNAFYPENVKDLNSFLQKVKEPKTIIIDRYIDLNGEVLNVKGCELVFIQGGILDNGTIQNAKIKAGLFQIFGKNLTLSNIDTEQAYPEWFGAIGDGVTDDTQAIQRAENLQVAKLKFIRKYKITQQIVKNSITSWEGNTYTELGETNTQKTEIFCSVNNDAITNIETATVQAEIEIKNLKIKNDGGTGKGLYLKHLRGVKLENINISDFNDSNIKLENGGQYYVKDVYSNRGAKGWELVGLADCWFYNCHGGTGNGKAGSNDKGIAGTGFYISNCKYINFVGCRGEVSTENGWEIRGSRRIKLIGCYADNNSRGVLIVNSEQIDIDNPHIFNNGNTTDTNNAQVEIAGNGLTSKGIKIYKGYINNLDGTSDYGVYAYEINGGKVENLIIDGVDISQHNNKEILTDVSSYQIFPKQLAPTFKTNIDFTYSKVYDGLLVITNGTLTADRTCTLSTRGLTEGETIDIQRTAGGNFIFSIKKPDNSTLINLNQGEGVEILYYNNDFRILKKYNIW